MDALFDEMLLQKAIETPHRLPKPEELKGKQYCRWHNSWNHSTNSCVVFRDPKKEIPIKMPGNEKPLATIIEGRWYSVGKSGRPTLELTRTQKRRVQRQYCAFLKNQGDAQVHPETSSARKGKNLEVLPQTERTTGQPQKLVKTESPGRPPIHPASSSVNQLQPSQAQGKSEPIPIEEQENWTEEYEEEQLDYEPSADDQNGLLEAREQEDWTEEYGEEQMEYDGELD
ncbi:unnamed protein product [Prunus brigantina]